MLAGSRLYPRKALQSQLIFELISDVIINLEDEVAGLLSPEHLDGASEEERLDAETKRIGFITNLCGG